MWLTETPWPPIAILLGSAAFIFLMWKQNARRQYLLAIGVCLTLSVVVFVVERMVVTDREQIEQLVSDLTSAFQQNDLDGTLEHFSTTAFAERLLAAWALNAVDVGEDLRITDLQVELFAENTRAKSHFRANGTVSGPGFSGHQPSRWRLTWERESGEWKVVHVERLNVVTGESLPIPQLTIGR